jgi:hypothetical protein
MRWVSRAFLSIFLALAFFRSPALPGTARQGRCAPGAHLPRAQVPGSVDGESTLPPQLPRQRTPGLSHSGNAPSGTQAVERLAKVEKGGFLVLTQ